MANRLTFHSGYRNANGKAFNSKHNQREAFQNSGSDKNVYVNFMSKGFGGDTFSETEKLFYEKLFEPHITRRNKKAKANRQYGRMITAADYREKHPPEEVLLYIGTKNVESAKLKAVFDDFVSWMTYNCMIKGENTGVVPLNAAMHLDEDTPHIHLRQVYIYTDKDGDVQVSQNKALDALGFKPPDTSKPVSRNNNAKMTFTATCRGKLIEIAKSHGVELVTEPLPKDEVGLPLKEYIQREQAREQVEKLKREVRDLEYRKEALEGEMERIRQESEHIIQASHKDAEKIREDAKEDAKKIYDDARKEGYAEGYTIGVHEGANSAKGRLHALQRKNDRVQAENSLNEAYNAFKGR